MHAEWLLELLSRRPARVGYTNTRTQGRVVRAQIRSRTNAFIETAPKLNIKTSVKYEIIMPHHPENHGFLFFYVSHEQGRIYGISRS